MTTKIILVQLGTPTEPTKEAVRRYLREFLSDRRVVDVNPWLWKPILHGIILRTRPKRSAALYRRIWTDAGSPLLVHTVALRHALRERLADEVLEVEIGMRYGSPSLRQALAGCEAGDVERVVVVPLFPQYSRVTSASVQDVIDEWQARARPRCVVDVVRSFPDHPKYIEALRRSVVDAGFEATPESPLVMSFHGIPQRYADRGDPYPRECESTASALAAALDLVPDAWRLTYQSRFGREPWLEPYTDETLERLARDGVRTVGIITPSFMADCLETIDEIGRESRERYLGAGGERFERIECLNGSESGVDAVEAVVRERL